MIEINLTDISYSYLDSNIAPNDKLNNLDEPISLLGHDTDKTYLINTNNISSIGLPNEAKNRKVKEEVHEEPSGSGVSVGPADYHIVLPVKVSIALLKTFDDLESIDRRYEIEVQMCSFDFMLCSMLPLSK